MKHLSDLDVRGKRVVLRVDYNVALKDGKVAEPKRIRATLPTLRYLLERDAKIVLISHLGRPKGKWDAKYSLAPAMTVLEELHRNGELPMSKCSLWGEDFRSPELKPVIQAMQAREIIILENLRFDPGEEKNDAAFASALASLGEIFVQEAFGAVHRAHASTAAITKLLPSAAGFLVAKELEILGKILNQPAQPFVVLLGGVKVSDKIGAIKNLLDRGASKILIGGALAYTFLKAKGLEVGKSIVSADWVDPCRALLADAKYGDRIVISRDHWAVPSLGFPPPAEAVKQAKLFSTGIPEGWEGLDVGPQTLESFKKELAAAKTIFWNGPVGLIEFPPFENGSSELARAVAQAAKNGALSVLGGGDTIHAVSKAGLKEEDFTHVSTGGGATLEFLEGKKLPGLLNGN